MRRGTTQDFKATAKGKGRLAVSAVGDIWLHALAVVLLASTIAIGVWQLVAGATALSPLLISVLWAVRALPACDACPAYPSACWILMTTG